MLVRTQTRIATLTLAALASAILAGCNKPVSETASNTNSAASATALTASNAWQSTKEDSSNAWEASKEATSNLWHKTAAALGAMGATNSISTNYFGYRYSEKDAFVSEAKAGMSDLDARISGLDSRLSTASGGAQTDLQQQLQGIKNRRSDLSTKYDAVNAANQQNWDDAKAAYIKAYLDLKASVKAAEDSVKAGM